MFMRNFQTNHIRLISLVLFTVSVAGCSGDSNGESNPGTKKGGARTDEFVMLLQPSEQANPNMIRHTDFSNDGMTAISTSQTSTHVWNIPAQESRLTFEGSHVPAALSPTGDYVFVTQDRQGILRAVDGGQPIRSLDFSPECVAISHDGNLLFASSTGGVGSHLSMWDLERGSRLPIAYPSPMRHVTSLGWSTSDDHVIVTGFAGQSPGIFRFYSFAGVSKYGSAGRPSVFTPHRRMTVGMAFDQSLPGLVSVGADGTMRLSLHFEADSSRGYNRDIIDVSRSESVHVLSADFDTHQQLVAIGHSDGSVDIWNWKDGTRTDSIRRHSQPVTAIAMHVDAAGQRRVLLGYRDGAVALWSSHPYDTVDIVVRTFIPSPATRPTGLEKLEPGGPALVHGGDNRSFGYNEASYPSRQRYRSFQRVKVTVDPSRRSPFLTTPQRDFGPSTAYQEKNVTSVSGKPMWWADFESDAQPFLPTRSLQVSETNNMVTWERISDSQIRVRCTVHAANPNEPTTRLMGLIDAKLDIILEQTKNHDVRYRVAGSHDGFPAYEIYLNGKLAYFHDPVENGNKPLDLLGNSDVTVVDSILTPIRLLPDEDANIYPFSAFR